jgi:peptidoglycan-associated lipoprotein
MMIKNVKRGLGSGLGSGLAVLAVFGLLAVGCSSDDGPEAAGVGGSSQGGAFGESIVDDGMGGSIAGRSPEGMAEARRLGLRTVYFDYDQSSLRQDGRETLRHNYDVLRQRTDVRVELQGNCDERGSSEYNFALGERRAHAVRDYLVQLGVPPSQLTTVSFGEENASVSGHGESAWAKNRRVDFAVLP